MCSPLKFDLLQCTEQVALMNICLGHVQLNGKRRWVGGNFMGVWADVEPTTEVLGAHVKRDVVECVFGVGSLLGPGGVYYRGHER